MARVREEAGDSHSRFNPMSEIGNGLCRHRGGCSGHAAMLLPLLLSKQL